MWKDFKRGFVVALGAGAAAVVWIMILAVIGALP